MRLPLDVADAGHLRADVCVVGSGPSGQAVARALAGSGHDVLVVEAGDVDPTRWGRRFASAVMPSAGRQYPNAGHQMMVRLGGTSDRWGVQLQPGMDPGTGSGLRLCRLDPIDLEGRPTLGLEAWPIEVDDLDPWYRRAEQLSGLGPGAAWSTETVVDDGQVSTELVWAVPAAPFLRGDIAGVRTVYRCPVRTLVAEPGGRISRAVAVSRSGEEVDIEADVFVLALGALHTTRLLLDSPWSGAPSVANSSGLVGRYLTDHPQLIIGQLVLDDHADLSGLEALAPSVEGGPTGPILRWPNLVTSPKRAATSDLTRLSATLLAVDDLSGRQRLLNRIPRPLGARTGAVNAVSALHDALDDRRADRSLLRRVPSLIGGFDEVAREALDLRTRSSWRIEDPHWAHRLHGADRPAGFQIFAIAEQLPNPDNRIVLSAEVNQIGARRPRVEWRWSDDDIRRAEESAEEIRHALWGLGVGHVLPRRGRASVHKINSHHPAGTARMAASPADGVVDADLRAHDHPNLYIVGAAVFHADGVITPTLTDVALGLRLGAHLGDR